MDNTTQIICGCTRITIQKQFHKCGISMPYRAFTAIRDDVLSSLYFYRSHDHATSIDTIKYNWKTQPNCITNNSYKTRYTYKCPLFSWISSFHDAINFTKNYMLSHNAARLQKVSAHRVYRMSCSVFTEPIRNVHRYHRYSKQCSLILIQQAIRHLSGSAAENIDGTYVCQLSVRGHSI